MLADALTDVLLGLYSLMYPIILTITNSSSEGKEAKGIKKREMEKCRLTERKVIINHLCLKILVHSCGFQIL